MGKQKYATAVKLLILCPYLILLYILQATVFTRLTLFGVKPMLLPVAVVVIAIFRGRVEGGVFGLFAGMFMDMSYNQPTIEFTLILTLTGILLGALSDTVLVRGFPSYLLCSAAQLLLCSACQILVITVTTSIPVSALLPIAIRQTLYSLILSLPFYYISRFLAHII